MKILVTGVAGFIGAALATRLLERGDTVLGIDNLSDYYDVSLKEARLARVGKHSNFTFSKLDIVDRKNLETLFRENEFDAVAHLAAQAGVRYSIDNPYAYIDANLVGFGNILEGCRHSGVKHLAFASSSSVYGANTKLPFSEHDNVDHPVSLYAASKKANELMAHCYAHLYGLPCTGLRFFTVYGPWGRPDMAPMIFAKAITQGQPIDVFNGGEMRRDFTFIDDIVESVLRVADCVPGPAPDAAGDPATSPIARHRVFNIGNGAPVDLMRFIEVMEAALGRKAVRNMLPMQPGDMKTTWADTADLEAATGWKPATSIEDGVERFVTWYQEFYRA